MFSFPLQLKHSLTFFIILILYLVFITLYAFILYLNIFFIFPT